MSLLSQDELFCISEFLSLQDCAKIFLVSNSWNSLDESDSFWKLMLDQVLKNHEEFSQHPVLIKNVLKKTKLTNKQKTKFTYKFVKEKKFFSLIGDLVNNKTEISSFKSFDKIFDCKMKKWDKILEEMKKFDDLTFLAKVHTKECPSLLDVFWMSDEHFLKFVVKQDEKYEKTIFSYFERIYDFSGLKILQRNSKSYSSSLISLVQLNHFPLFQKVISKCEQEFKEVLKTDDHQWILKSMLKENVDVDSLKLVHSFFDMTYTVNDIDNFFRANTSTDSWKFMLPKFKTIKKHVPPYFVFRNFLYNDNDSLQKLDLYFHHSGKIPTTQENTLINIFTIFPCLPRNKVTEVVEFLMKYENNDNYDTDGVSFLGFICFHGSVEFIEKLLERGVKPNLKGLINDIVLKKYSSDVIPAIKLMIKFKADLSEIDVEDFYKKTKDSLDRPTIMEIIKILTDSGCHNNLSFDDISVSDWMIKIGQSAKGFLKHK